MPGEVFLVVLDAGKSSQLQLNERKEVLVLLTLDFLRGFIFLFTDCKLGSLINHSRFISFFLCRNAIHMLLVQSVILGLSFISAFHGGSSLVSPTGLIFISTSLHVSIVLLSSLDGRFSLSCLSIVIFSGSSLVVVLS